jgi:spore germination protein GerM
VKDGLATVDFTKELTTRFVGGSTGEEMLVGSLVNTLTEFPEVTSVLILVEGKEIDTISGHLDTSVPFKRMGELL